MFEHHITFINRSNSTVNIAILNSNVVHAWKNELEAGESWTWTEGWPIGYDIAVFHDIEETRIDASGHNISVILGYVMIGGSVVAAALALAAEAVTLGITVAPSTAVQDAALSTFTGGLAIVGGGLAAAGVATEIVSAILTPAKLTGLYGTDNYTIEIGGNARLVNPRIVDGMLTDFDVDYDPISLSWKNETSGTEGFTRPFLWIWAKNPIKGLVKDIAVMPDGSIAGIGMDNKIWMRPDLSSEWTVTPKSQVMHEPTEYDDRRHPASMISIAADKKGELYCLIANRFKGEARSIWRMRTPGITGWEQVKINCHQAGLEAADTIFVDKGTLGIVTKGGIGVFSLDTSERIIDLSVTGDLTYIAPTKSGVYLGIDTDKRLLMGKAFGNTSQRAGDHQNLLAVDQLPDGHLIGIVEDHELVFGAIFDEALLVKS